jgi:hypothetical protein
VQRLGDFGEVEAATDGFAHGAQLLEIHGLGFRCQVLQPARWTSPSRGMAVGQDARPDTGSPESLSDKRLLIAIRYA